MAECPGYTDDPSKIYYKEAILKKEGKNWTEYYAVLTPSALVFNRKDERTGKLIPNNITTVEINKKSVVALAEKTCYRFPFWIQTGKVTYNFKCETKLQRYKWMYAIRLSASGKPPETIPNFISTRSRAERQRSRSVSATSKLVPRKATASLRETNNASVRKKTNAYNTVPLVSNGNAGTKSDVTGNVQNTPALDASGMKMEIQKGNISSESSSEESKKTKEKSVKWDLRSVINYVNKTITTEVGLNKQKHRKDNNLQKFVLENIHTLNADRKYRSSSVDDLTSPKLKQAGNLKSHKSTVMRKSGEVDEWVVEDFDHNLVDYSHAELENLSKVPKEHDESEGYPIPSNITSVLHYRNDGDIESFPTSDIEFVYPGLMTTDRFGNHQDSIQFNSSTTATVRPHKRLSNIKKHSSSYRAQSWTSLNLIRSPQSTPLRRENSAPPLRFSRFDEKDLESIRKT